MEGETLKYKGYVYSANHTFYYDNYSETEFKVTKVISNDNYNDRVSEVYDERSINRQNGDSISDRIEVVGNEEGNDIRNSSYARYGSTSTGDVGILERGTTNRRAGNLSENGKDYRVSDIAPVKA